MVCLGQWVIFQETMFALHERSRSSWAVFGSVRAPVSFVGQVTGSSHTLTIRKCQGGAGGERKETVIGGLEVSRGAIKGAREGWRYDLISDPVTDFGSIAKYCCWLPGALPAS